MFFGANFLRVYKTMAPAKPSKNGAPYNSWASKLTVSMLSSNMTKVSIRYRLTSITDDQRATRVSWPLVNHSVLDCGSFSSAKNGARNIKITTAASKTSIIPDQAPANANIMPKLAQIHSCVALSE